MAMRSPARTPCLRRNPAMRQTAAPYCSQLIGFHTPPALKCMACAGPRSFTGRWNGSGIVDAEGSTTGPSGAWTGVSGLLAWAGGATADEGGASTAGTAASRVAAGALPSVRGPPTFAATRAAALLREALLALRVPGGREAGGIAGGLSDRPAACSASGATALLRLLLVLEPAMSLLAARRHLCASAPGRTGLQYIRGASVVIGVLRLGIQ